MDGAATPKKAPGYSRGGRETIIAPRTPVAKPRLSKEKFAGAVPGVLDSQYRQELAGSLAEEELP